MEADKQQEQAAAIERQQIEWVFGLTGGELSDEPWMNATPQEFEQDCYSFGDKYWYEGCPEYAERDIEQEHGSGTYRTTLTWGGGYLPYPSKLMYDGDGEWELVDSFRNSGEAECPFRQCDDNKTVPGLCPACGQMVWIIDTTTSDQRLIGSCGDAFLKSKWEEAPVNECDLCEEKQGEDHGYIYIGEGYEAVYRLLVQFEVVVGNIGTVYEGSDEDAAQAAFLEYKLQSKTDTGRAAGEDVTLFKDGEIDQEYEGDGTKN